MLQTLCEAERLGLLLLILVIMSATSNAAERIGNMREKSLRDGSDTSHICKRT